MSLLDSHEKTETHRESNVPKQAEFGVTQLQQGATDCQQSPEARRRQGRIPLHVSGGAWPSLHLDRRLLASRIVRQ